jgi:hypothetical protein
MNPPTLAAASITSTGALETCRGDHTCNSILGSIAVIRSAFFQILPQATYLADTFPPLPSNSNQQQQRQQEDQIIVTVQNKSGTLAQDEVRCALKKLTIQ